MRVYVGLIMLADVAGSYVDVPISYTAMTLVKSLHCGDPNVIQNTRTYKASARHQAICLASAVQPAS